MSTTVSSLDPQQATAAATQRWRRWFDAYRLKLAAPLALALAGGWIGGLAGLSAVIVGGAALAWMFAVTPASVGAEPLVDPSAAPEPSAPTAPTAAVSAAAADPAIARNGAQMMISQVVPVWSRQVALTRDAANEGLSQMLELFSQMAPALDALATGMDTLAPSIEPGAIGHAVSVQAGALDALTAASRRAFEQRDAIAAQLGRCAEAMEELRQIGKTARETARHTRMVALNATIEANRDTSGDGGAKSVAAETRMLADRMAQAGDRIDKLAARLAPELSAARRSAMLQEVPADELRVEIGMLARDALAALLGSSGLSLHGSAALRQATEQLREQLDAVYVHFQFGDRVSQMLTAVSDDMRKFAHWTWSHPNATPLDATEWLAALETSYTMEEQRSQHHGNVHIDRGSEVEFF